MHTWLGINPQIGIPLSRIVGAIGLFFFICKKGRRNTVEDNRRVAMLSAILKRFELLFYRTM
jgi:hypothetical protein